MKNKLYDNKLCDKNIKKLEEKLLKLQLKIDKLRKLQKERPIILGSWRKGSHHTEEAKLKISMKNKKRRTFHTIDNYNVENPTIYFGKNKVEFCVNLTKKLAHTPIENIDYWRLYCNDEAINNKYFKQYYNFESIKELLESIVCEGTIRAFPREYNGQRIITYFQIENNGNINFYNRRTNLLLLTFDKNYNVVYIEPNYKARYHSCQTIHSKKVWLKKYLISNDIDTDLHI